MTYFMDFIGQSSLFNCIPIGARYAYLLKAFDNSVFFNTLKTFVPNEQFDLDIIPKVTAAIINLNLADLNCGTNLPQASNQDVLMYWCWPLKGLPRMVDQGHCDRHGGHRRSKHLPLECMYVCSG